MGMTFWGSVAQMGTELLSDIGIDIGGGELAQVGADTVSAIPNMVNGDALSGAPGVVGGVESAVGGAASNWWEKGIEQMMPSIMGAAMRPKPQQHAPVAPSGHGVQVNTSGMMKPFDEVRSMADDNPLSGIHQWSSLFG